MEVLTRCTVDDVDVPFTAMIDLCAFCCFTLIEVPITFAQKHEKGKKLESRPTPVERFVLSDYGMYDCQKICFACLSV